MALKPGDIVLIVPLLVHGPHGTRPFKATLIEEDFNWSHSSWLILNHRNGLEESWMTCCVHLGDLTKLEKAIYEV